LAGQTTAVERARAYEQLVRRWAARVTAVCHARVGRADVAEDLAQETMLRGMQSLASLSDPEKFGPWLRGIATRTCLDWLKSKQRTETSLEALPEADPPALDSPDRVVDCREQIDRLMAEVERLPEAYREVLMLYYYEDQTYEELAELLGVSAATVNARLTKARMMLRQRVGVDA
jgi:RNA polymerase sigma factor (sigma-70 family)